MTALTPAQTARLSTLLHRGLAYRTALAMCDVGIPPADLLDGKPVKWNSTTGQFEDATSTIQALGNGTYAPLPGASRNPLTGMFHADGFVSAQAAIDAAAGNLGDVYFQSSFSISAALTLPSTLPVRIRAAPGVQVTASAAMTAMISKPAGACSGIALTDLNLDANRLADRCVDIEQAHRLHIKSGNWRNALVCVADFGRQGGQVYEMDWRATRVRGLDSARAAAAPSQMAPYGYRFGVNTTDNVVDNVVVANCATTCVTDAGGGNVHRSVHAFGYPYATSGNANEYATATGFVSTGGINRFVDCYADTLPIGFSVQGQSVAIVNPLFYYPSDWTFSSDLIGIDVGANDCSIVAPTFRLPGGLVGYPVRVGNGVTAPLLVAPNIYGSGWKAPWVLVGSGAAPLVVGGAWDGGVLPSTQDISGSAGTNRDLTFSTKGGASANKRWAWRLNNDAEVGNSQGSNLSLISYLDSGNFGFNVMQLQRNSGIWVNQRAVQRTRAAQTVAASGPVAIDSAASSYHRVSLQANATATTISNSSVTGGSTTPQSGQELTVAWLQDATGGRTYTWPTNCRFAGSAAPADTTPNRLTSVSFVYDGSNSVWLETGRAVAVPVS